MSSKGAWLVLAVDRLCRYADSTSSLVALPAAASLNIVFLFQGQGGS